MPSKSEAPHPEARQGPQAYAGRFQAITGPIRARLGADKAPTLRNLCLLFIRNEALAKSTSQLLGRFMSVLVLGEPDDDVNFLDPIPPWAAAAYFIWDVIRLARPGPKWYSNHDFPRPGFLINAVGIDLPALETTGSLEFRRASTERANREALEALWDAEFLPDTWVRDEALRCGYGDVQLDRCRPATPWELGFATRQRQARKNGVELPEAARSSSLPQEPPSPDGERYSRRIAKLSVECPTSYRRPDVRVPVIPPAFLAMMERREQRDAAKALGFDLDVQPRGRQRLVVTSPPSSRAPSPAASLPPSPASVPAPLSSTRASPISDALLFQVSVTPESSPPRPPMASPLRTPPLHSRHDWTPLGDYTVGPADLREATFDSSSVSDSAASSPLSSVGELTPGGWLSPCLSDAMALPELPQPFMPPAPSTPSAESLIFVNSHFFEVLYFTRHGLPISPDTRSFIPALLGYDYVHGRDSFPMEPVSPPSQDGVLQPAVGTDTPPESDPASLLFAGSSTSTGPETPLSPVLPVIDTLGDTAVSSTASSPSNAPTPVLDELDSPTSSTPASPSMDATQSPASSDLLEVEVMLRFPHAGVMEED
uniref:Uncharacterized protein n=1 Tax=Schizophyllum commune (strain H4-8 / FGSC 9210) TaxID=578458 RepID=D8Q5G2_SCHCM